MCNNNSVPDAANGDVYRQLLDSVADCAICMIDADGVIGAWNAGAYALTGYAPKEAIGQKLHDFLECKPLATSIASLQSACADAANSLKTEAIWVRKDGSRFLGLIAATCIHDEAGRKIGVSVVARDLADSGQDGSAGFGGDVAWRSIMANSPVGFALVSIDGHWVEVNDALSNLLGYSAEELSHLTFHDVTHAEDLEIDLQLVNELLTGKRDNYRMEKRYLRKDGMRIWGLLAVSLIRDANGMPAYFIAQIQDMTDVRELQRELEYKALHDSLTGLANRRKFENALSDAVENARRDDCEHCLCFIDLDGFKAVNDQAGHDAGDMVLAAISRELEGAVRSGDLVARIGGDEFGILLYDCDLQTGRRILDRLRNSIMNLTFKWERNRYRVTTSIGLAAITRDADSMQEILRHADMACYEVKRAGRNAVHVHKGSSVSRIVRLAS